MIPGPGYGSQPGSRGHSRANSRMGSRQPSYAQSKPVAPGMGNRDHSYVHKRLAKMKKEEEGA